MVAKKRDFQMLQLWTALNIAANTVAFFNGLLSRQHLIEQFPRLSEGLFTVYLLISPLIIGSCIGILQKRSGAIWAGLGLYLLMILMDWYIGAPFHAVLVVFNLVVFGILLWLNRRYFQLNWQK